MTEKKRVEKATAEKFIEMYNKKFSTFFVVKKQLNPPNPDIFCEDKGGSQLNLEITLTEDQDGDIKALLGRSEHKNHIGGSISSFPGNVMEHACRRIIKKMSNDYGMNVALVVRDVSPLEWDWNMHTSEFVKKLKGISSPFDKGIWILTTSQNQNKIFKIL